MSIKWTDDQLKAAKIPKRKLQALVKRLERCSKEMAELQLEVYGASGSGHLIHRSRPTHIDTPGVNGGKADFGSIVASVGFGFNGGDW